MALENYNQSMFKTGTLQQIPSKVFDWISGGHRENFSTSADFSWKELLLPSSSTSGEAQTALYDSNAKQRFAAYLGGGLFYFQSLQQTVCVLSNSPKWNISM